MVGCGHICSSQCSLQLLENDIQVHQDRVDEVMAKVRRFKEANHFQIDQIEDKGRSLVAK